MGDSFTWVDIYMELADRLKQFKDDRGRLLELIQGVYDDLGMHLPTLDFGNIVPSDIDPFTVFGLFNKGISTRNRIAILRCLSERLDLKSKIPEEFDGIPILNNLSATFYGFGDQRKSDDIDNLWRMFIVALDLAEEESLERRDAFIECFDRVRNQRSVKWNLTMGLFWIRPNRYINLDGRNRWFLFKSDKWVNWDVKDPGDNMVSATTYLDITDRCWKVLESGTLGCHSFPELSYNAWSSSEEENRLIKKSRIASAEESDYSVDADVDEVHYWIYSAGPLSIEWDRFHEQGIMAISDRGIGDFGKYSSRTEIKDTMKSVRADNKTYKMISSEAWDFVHNMKTGDIVFVKRGRDTIVGRGIVESEALYDPDTDDDYGNFRRVDWTDHGEWQHPGKAVSKYLTDITPYTDYVNLLKELFEDTEQDTSDEVERTYPQYTRENFLEEVYMDSSEYDALTDRLRRKSNIILQGAPGVGKTYIAKRLAYSMMGMKDKSRVMMVQFHQSYSYEDFIEGYRPSMGGFELRKGPFYEFCHKAAEDPEEDYFFIIDEINRGNMGKILGELFMLIEKDKRGSETQLRLLYSGEMFYVPENLYIIGTMNTADRSLAMMDYALRRRFSFFEIRPAFDRPSFGKNSDKWSPEFRRLVEAVRKLNETISDDASLGRGFCMGHSYLCAGDPSDASWLESVIQCDIVPLLEEYWFDEPDKVDEWKSLLLGAVK